MTLTIGKRQLFPSKKINLVSYIPEEVQVPIFPEGESVLTITKCLLKSSHNMGRERIEIEFKDDENRLLRQIFYLDTGIVNFAKFINNIFGDVPSGEFDPSSLVGIKIKAFIYHNYLSNGKGYANIALCEPYQENHLEIHD